jgi:effector-binding domain-containing protein
MTRAALARRPQKHNYRHHSASQAQIANLIREGAIATQEVTIRDIEAVDVIGVTFRTAPESISEDGAQAMKDLLEGLDRDDITPSGPPRFVYHALDEDAWTIEACIPVTDVQRAPQGLQLRHFDGGPAATTIHVGPYDQLGRAYRELAVWMENQGLKTGGPPFDIYLNDPNEVKDPAKFETELVWPVGST